MREFRLIGALSYSIKESNIERKIYEYELGKDYGLLEFERRVIAFKRDVVVICK